MLYVTGDLHIPIDIEKLNRKRFPEQKQLTKRDLVVVCGDFGGIWSGGRKDRYWLRWLERKRFTTLFVDGNHENFDLLDALPVQRWNGGNVHQVADGVYHLMRGQVYSVEGRRLFAMGGGASGDREFRTEGVSWWPREMPSDAEYREAWENLRAAGFRVDYVFTHTAPSPVAARFRTRETEQPLQAFLEQTAGRLQFSHWYFGHMHRDIELDDRFTAVYQRVLRVW